MCGCDLFQGGCGFFGWVRVGVNWMWVGVWVWMGVDGWGMGVGGCT